MAAPLMADLGSQAQRKLSQLQILIADPLAMRVRRPLLATVVHGGVGSGGRVHREMFDFLHIQYHNLLENFSIFLP